MSLIPRPMTIMEFITTDHGYKRAFYLDGRLYRVFGNTGDRMRAVGKSHFAAVDIEDGSLDLVLARYGQPEQRLSLTTEVVACNDVAVLDGPGPGMENRLKRWAFPPRRFGVSDLDVYLQTRTVCGCVDYRVVYDNLGLESKRVSVLWQSPPSVTVVEAEELGGRATTFTFLNDYDNQDSLVVTKDREWEFVLAGPQLAFSQPSVATFV